MNFAYVFVLVLSIGCALGQTQNETNSKIETWLYRRCQQNSINAVTYDNIKTNLHTFLKYFQYTSSLLPSGKEQFCVDETQKLRGYLSSLTKEMSSCFPREEKYLPQFIYDSFSEFLHFLCDRKGLNINNFFSTSGSQCLSALRNTQGGNENGQCFGKIFAPLNNVVEKQGLCDALETARKCFSLSLLTHCSEFRSFQLMNEHLFEALKKPCFVAPKTKSSASTYLVSSLLTAFLAFIVYKF